MKRLLSIILLGLLTLQMSAQVSIKEVLKSMPNSITPLLEKNTKLNFIDYIDAGQKAVEKNRLGGKSELMKLTDTRALIQMTEVSTMDIKLLSTPEPAIGIITTVRSDSTTFASVIKYYSPDWQLTKTVYPEAFSKVEWNDEGEDLITTKHNPLEIKFE